MTNGGNGDGNGDPALPKFAWTIGQMLVDREDPTRGLKRADKPFFHAEFKWEKEGQSSNCTVMHDGMVFFGGRWLLYYGGGDRHIGLAIYAPPAGGKLDGGTKRSTRGTR